MKETNSNNKRRDTHKQIISSSPLLFFYCLFSSVVQLENVCQQDGRDYRLWVQISPPTSLLSGCHVFDKLTLLSHHLLAGIKTPTVNSISDINFCLSYLCKPKICPPFGQSWALLARYLVRPINFHFRCQTQPQSASIAGKVCLIRPHVDCTSVQILHTHLGQCELLLW